MPHGYLGWYGPGLILMSPESNSNMSATCDGVFMADSWAFPLFTSWIKWNKLTGMLSMKLGNGSPKLTQAQSSLDLSAGCDDNDGRHGRGVVACILKRTQPMVQKLRMYFNSMVRSYSKMASIEVKGCTMPAKIKIKLWQNEAHPFKIAIKTSKVMKTRMSHYYTQKN